jgi:hypothetical protein
MTHTSLPVPEEPVDEPSGHTRYRTEELPEPVTAIRYYLPVEIHVNGKGTGSYHYCCCLYPGYEVWAVGYCSKKCSGHRSKTEAREHYRQFLIDKFAQYDGRLNSPAACGVCGRITTHHAWIDYHFDWGVLPLCPKHLNREGLWAAFVLKDYHLLQISDPRLSAVATITGSDGPISIVRSISAESRC